MNLLPCPFCGSEELNEDTDEHCLDVIICTCDSIVRKIIWNTRHTPWISVKDYPCPIDKEILITDGRGIYVTIIDQGSLDKEYFSMMIDDRLFELDSFGVTHWMPLPKLPEGK